MGKAKRWRKLKCKKLKIFMQLFQYQFFREQSSIFQTNRWWKFLYKIIAPWKTITLYSIKWWKIYNHAFVVTMTLANFWKLVIVSYDSFILITIWFMLSLWCGIHENRGEGGEEGLEGEIWNYVFQKTINEGM